MQEEVAGEAEVFLWREFGGERRACLSPAKAGREQLPSLRLRGNDKSTRLAQRVKNGSTRWAARTNATMTAMPARKKITCSA